ncbi:hypothetical protein ISF_01724 [Cordyceps fumosorosea ARSEF 2679]|uniref:Uncharacterized protein n=1 Tax=Cordyceps fumosorosea (strain ARSEF 2679) TaxID=1081104 RepID=A0A168CB26_CORFA|nr:hypothetical protein ISF_01724 [Cordyceps fumosorosea ARSEF 2679]OAA71173.1 hypothetical protein ISF_01724 [Cordyceps fumosorosea ARSEF 2679]
MSLSGPSEISLPLCSQPMAAEQGVSHTTNTETPPRPKQAGSHFLNLPMELIIQMAADFLPRRDQYRLLQTCTALRLILRSRFRSFLLGPVDPRQQLEYLQLRASTAPYHWVCEECLDLHMVSVKDSEADSPVNSHPRCPLRELHSTAVSSRPKRPIFHSLSYDFYGFQLHHRFVQLALKWERMGGAKGGRFGAHLRRLLSGHGPVKLQDEDLGVHIERLGAEPWEEITFRCRVRVVGGRFMLETRYDFLSRPVWPDIQAALFLCPHQSWLAPRTFEFQMLHSIGNTEWIREALNARCSALAESMKAVEENRAASVALSCPYCPTDIRVTFVEMSNRMLLRAHAYHDFCGDSLPTDLDWHKWDLSTDSDGKPLMESSHKPGGVKQLWDMGDSVN